MGKVTNFVCYETKSRGWQVTNVVRYEIKNGSWNFMIFCVYTNIFCKFENFNAKRGHNLY